MDPNNQLQPNNNTLDIIFNNLRKPQIKLLNWVKSASKDCLALIKVRVQNEPQKLIIASKVYPFSFYTLDSQSPNDFVQVDSFSDRDLQIVGSCHGVLLLRLRSCLPHNNNILHLWNPLTGKHKLITPPDDATINNVIIEGLGYDSAREEFKLVMAIEDREHPAYVLSTSNSVSSSSSWNSIGVFRYKKYSDYNAVVLNGSPHWIVTRQRRADVIVYFDPHNEVFGELPVPVVDSYYFIRRLIILGKNLCWVTYSADKFQVLVLKESSWSKLFVVPRRPGEDLVHVFMPPLCTATTTVDGELEDDLNSGEALVYRPDIDHALSLYNLKDKRFKKRLKLPQGCMMEDAVCYMETAASP